MRLILRIEAKFRSFWPTVKIMGRFAKFFRVTFWRHLGPNHWYTFDGAPLRRLAAMTVRGKKKFRGKLENVAITNALQLEAARCRAVPIRLISSPVPSSKSLSLSVTVLERFYCLYVTLRCDLELWPRDLDLWPLTLNICSVLAVPRSNCVPNLSKIEQSTELLRFEYLTLWPWTCMVCCAMLWVSLHKV